jgi:hypothetical protein
MMHGLSSGQHSLVRFGSDFVQTSRYLVYQHGLCISTHLQNTQVNIDYRQLCIDSRTTSNSSLQWHPDCRPADIPFLCRTAGVAQNPCSLCLESSGKTQGSKHLCFVLGRTDVMIRDCPDCLSGLRIGLTHGALSYPIQ